MLDIHPMLMLFDLVLFLFLLVTLNHMLYTPLLRFMEQRDRTITNDLNATKGLMGNTEALHAEAEGILNDARSNAAQIRQKAIDDAKVLAEGKIKSKQAELERGYQSFLENLEGEKEQLTNALLAKMPLFKESIQAKFNNLKG